MQQIEKLLQKKINIFVIVLSNILMCSSCSGNATLGTETFNDSIDTTLQIDTTLVIDTIIVDSIATDSVIVDSVAVDEDADLPEFEPSTVVDKTKKELKQHLISLNEIIDKATNDLNNDSISNEEALNIGKNVISTIDSIAKTPKANEFKNQIKTVTRRANKLIEISKPNDDISK